MKILEDIAVELQQANQPYIHLRDYSTTSGNSLAAMLWKMRDDPSPAAPPDGAEDDATARIGVRALLKAVTAPGADPEKWPVDFFHRSMREYFFARALARRLEREDHDQARRILEPTLLPPEITHFAAEILRTHSDSTPLSRLTSFTRSATVDLDNAYLGGNSITLLYATRGKLPAYDWSDLRLDHARLGGADLTEARFARSSLRGANLDNADLTRVDFTGADLEGVRLEETARVAAVTTLGDDRIVAAYEDGTLRGWRPRPGGTATNHVIASLDHRVERLQSTPHQRLIAIGDGRCTILDPDGQHVRARASFITKSRFRPSLAGHQSVLFLEETSGGWNRAIWVDPTTTHTLDHRDVEAVVSCYAQADGRAYALATENGQEPGSGTHEGTTITVNLPDAASTHRQLLLTDNRVSCLALHHRQGGGLLLAVGRHDGSVTVRNVPVNDPDDPPAVLWHHDLHTGTVTTIAFADDDRLITGGADRIVCDIRTGAAGFGTADPQIQRLHLTLRCEGVKFDGVRTPYEQQRLRRYSAT
ncbi:pentapeptide repeat-containing protein [Micromonospora sp. NIE79]|uniref:Pentapeptide repeat-containing protein n=1 Tax=Micromonospora trifolii TaxID=2911208 RepID=A0ABS9N844_9ACTN|nr:pentapeptide repeat-containing protein [Micromonospora trifolii]MCG5446115.1 pentapeptide repeat-containing protein [Micromonospora trifolii]